MDQWARVLSLQHWDLSLNLSIHTRDSSWLNMCVTAFRCRTEEGECWELAAQTPSRKWKLAEQWESQRMTQCPVLDTGAHIYPWVHTVTGVHHTLPPHTHMNYSQDLRDGSGSSPDKVRHMVAAFYNPSVAMVTWEAETRQFLKAPGTTAGILQGQTGDQFC